MRDIKFRGKELGTEQWVYGNLVKLADGQVCIIPQNIIGDSIPQYSVDPETVGQYTGLQDRNGKNIYEGDILLDQHFDSGTGEVYFDPELAVWKVRFQQEDWLYEFHDCSEVIGNRFDNPELLGEVRE